MENEQNLLVPKIIHRIWMVWNPTKPEMSELYKENDQILKNLHPDWYFMEWDDKKVLNFVHDIYPEFFETYISYDVPVKRHDASRYLILKHYGGVFIQHSFRFQKNIEPLLQDYELVFSKKTDKFSDRLKNELCNNFIATVPNHKFWNDMISTLPAKAGTYVMDATGPTLLTEVVKNYQQKNHDQSIKILDHKYLFPFYFFEKNNPLIKDNCIDQPSKCFDLFPDIYAFCPWTSSWNEKQNQVAKVDLSMLESHLSLTIGTEVELLGNSS